MKPAKSLFKLTLISGVMSALFSAQTFATEAEQSVAEKIAAAINHIKQLPDEMKTVKTIEAGEKEGVYIIPADNNKSIYIENAGGLSGARKPKNNGTPNPVIILKNSGEMNEKYTLPEPDPHDVGVNLKGTKLYVHNQKESNIGQGLKLSNAEEVYVKNDGALEDFLTYNSKRVEIDNSGKIVQITTQSNASALPPISDTYDMSEYVVVRNTGHIKYFNLLGNEVILDNSGNIETLGVSALKGNITVSGSPDNAGNIDNLEIGMVNSKDYILSTIIAALKQQAPHLIEQNKGDYLKKLTGYLTAYSDDENAAELYRTLGIQNQADLTIYHQKIDKQVKEYIKQNSGDIELHLEDATVNYLVLNRNGRNDKFPEQSELDYVPPTKIFINKDTKLKYIDNYNGYYYVLDNATNNTHEELFDFDNDDTLVLVGDNPEKFDPKIYNGIANLRVENGNWIIDSDNMKFAKKISITPNSSLHFHGSNITSANFYIEPNAQLKVENDFQLNSHLINQGSIQFETPNASDESAVKLHQLTVSQDYKGENGVIAMRVNLQEDPALHDTLIIKGNANGTSKVQLNTLGPSLRLKTKQTPTLIKTKSASKGAFTLLKSQFGPYRYSLLPMDKNGEIHWVLKQGYFGGIANMLTALDSTQQLFSTTFYDRTGAARNANGVWVRLNYQHNKANIQGADTAIAAKSHRHSLQIGYDIHSAEYQQQRFTYGAALNYGVDKTASQFTDDPSQTASKLKGYGVSLYANLQKNNWYVDTWLSYNQFKNRIADEEKDMIYSMRSFQAAVELGYQHLLKAGNYQLAIQPQWQGIYQYVPQFHLPLEETKIEILHRNSLTSRLGVRLALSTTQKIKPFVELNWIYRNKPTALQIEDEQFTLQGNRNLAEIKLGLAQLNLSKNLSVWGHLAHRFGQQGYQNTQVQLNASYRF